MTKWYIIIAVMGFLLGFLVPLSSNKGEQISADQLSKTVMLIALGFLVLLANSVWRHYEEREEHNKEKREILEYEREKIKEAIAKSHTEVITGNKQQAIEKLLATFNSEATMIDAPKYDDKI